MAAELIGRNVEAQDGTRWDRLYKVGNSKIYINFARNSKEENDKVLEDIKQVHIDILRGIAARENED